MEKVKYPAPFKRKGTSVYSYFVTVDGKRVMRSTGCKKKSDAQNFIYDLIDAQAKPPAPPPVTFAEYSRPFFVWEKDKEPLCPHAARLVIEGRTIGRQYCLGARRLLDRVLARFPEFGALNLHDIRRAHVIDLRTKLKEAFPPRTGALMLEAIKTVFSEAEIREDLERNPGSKVGKGKAEKKQRGAFNADEVRGILAATPGRMGTEPRIKAMMVCMFTTGCRAGEIRGLRWRNVDLKTRNVKIIEAAKGESGTETGLPKWDKCRSFTMAKITRDALETWKAVSPYTQPDHFIFPTPDGAMVSHQVIKDAWASMMTAATAGEHPLIKTGARWLTPHSCRHSLNTILLQAGCNALDVAEFMGWSSTMGRAVSQVQAGYTDLKIIDPRAIADAIDKVLGPKAAAKLEKLA